MNDTNPDEKNHSGAFGEEPWPRQPLEELLASLPELPLGNLGEFLEGASRWVDRALPRYIPRGEPAEYLYDLAWDYPTRGGKRFRPALLLLCCALAGGDSRRALPSALALELFQNFALVHDDIEDNSWVRRGKMALHRQHGIPLALNAGDLLFSLVHEALLDNAGLLGAGPALRVMREFSLVFRMTFEGQAMDIGWIVGNHLPDREGFEAMIRRKTGWYSGRGPCQLGALIGGASPEMQGVLGDFGEALGIGFQLRDDLLNLTEDSAKAAPEGMGGGYGKERGGDIAEGKRTLIVLEMMERLPPDQGHRLREILIRPGAENTPGEIEWVIGKAAETGALDAVRARCRELGEKAAQHLERLPAGPHRDLLAGLTRYLVEERAA
ncbi:MAG: polyprenyl synthetase family protein [Deltaproteobacteria bacterium]|nr:polyprenyl synthetase family protein [Deltaproteobacteria bacterium]